MQIYNVKDGKHQKTHLSQKYGVAHAMFGHATGCIIHASTKVNRKPSSHQTSHLITLKLAVSSKSLIFFIDTIRYLSTHDNTYLRYFEGHTSTVTALSLHPGNDTFLSCSEDNTLRIWDAATKNHCGRLDLNGAYLSAWDPSGNVFAVASPTSQSILLYDFRNYDKEPFATFDVLPYTQQIPGLGGRGWNKLEFSNDGKSLLLGTTANAHILLDAFTGELRCLLRRDRGSSKRLAPGDHNSEHVNHHSSEWLHTSSGDACFTPDGRYVISGSRGEKIMIWDTMGSAQEKVLSPIHEIDGKGEAAVVAFSPRHNFFAVADKEVVFWMPDLNFA